MVFDTELKGKAEKMLKDDQILLDERMKLDSDLFNLVPLYTKLTQANKTEIPNSVWVNLNDAAVFAWRVETALNMAVEQISVTSKDKRFDTAYVEEFIGAYFDAADTILGQKDFFPFNSFVDQQTCRRGRTINRSLPYLDGKELICDIATWDSRYVRYGVDRKGLGFAVNKTKRSKGQIESEYPDAPIIPNTTQDIDVLDIWTPERNEVWAGNVLAKGIKNFDGYVPVTHHIVPMGSMLLDEDGEKYQGESILFLIRDLLIEVCRLASMIQSLNLKGVDSALQLKMPKASIIPGMKVKGKDEVDDPAHVEVVETPGGYELMPIGQLAQQIELLHIMIQERIDRATMTYFQSQAQPKTATEIIGIAQERGDILLPRLGTRGLEKQDLARMFIKQTIRLAEGADLKEITIDGEDWEIAKLKGAYKIEFKYSFKDPKMDIARASMAAAQRGMIPDKAIRRDTLMREDPEGDERELRWQEAEILSPLVKMDRTIMGLLEEAERGQEGAEEEAMMLALQMLPALDQAMAGQMTPAPSEEVKPEPPLVAAIGRQ